MIYINLLIVFICIVFIHEFGHYLFARIFKAEVTDFSIGFGKPIFQFKDKNNTIWKICPIPLGGYVKIKGLDSVFQKNSNDEPGSFQSLQLYQKIFILLAGSVFNILSAWIALFSIFFFFGIASFLPIIGKVIDDSAAKENDLRVNDVIISVNNLQIDEFSDIPKALGSDKSISLLVERGGQIIEKNFDLKFNDEINRYVIGISTNNEPIIDKYNLNKSIQNSLIFIPTYYAASINFLKKSYQDNTLGDQLAGPVGIVKMADQMMLDKIRGVIFLFIVISLFVGVFNLLPIPLLDGGHIVYFVISKIFSNSLPELVTRIYIATGITIISFLFIFITFNDIFYK
ncbi:site-2 protease family protein [Pelagibacterales bacterium SAG-MED31]|nr:site-2 protease family protein [Pelagibacterales bacterium SAG-MED31]